MCIIITFRGNKRFLVSFTMHETDCGLVNQSYKIIVPNLAKYQLEKINTKTIYEPGGNRDLSDDQIVSSMTESQILIMSCDFLFSAQSHHAISQHIIKQFVCGASDLLPNQVCCVLPSN